MPNPCHYQTKISPCCPPLSLGSEGCSPKIDEDEVSDNPPRCPEAWRRETCCLHPRKVDIKLPGKGNSDYHGARPVHQIIKMMKWIRTSGLPIKNSFSVFLVAAENVLPPPPPPSPAQARVDAYLVRWIRVGMCSNSVLQALKDLTSRSLFRGLKWSIDGCTNGA